MTGSDIAKIGETFGIEVLVVGDRHMVVVVVVNVEAETMGLEMQTPRMDGVAQR